LVLRWTYQARPLTIPRGLFVRILRELRLILIDENFIDVQFEEQADHGVVE
jgi:hypothetical protein